MDEKEEIVLPKGAVLETEFELPKGAKLVGEEVKKKGFAGQLKEQGFLGESGPSSDQVSKEGVLTAENQSESTSGNSLAEQRREVDFNKKKVQDAFGEAYKGKYPKQHFISPEYSEDLGKFISKETESASAIAQRQLDSWSTARVKELKASGMDEAKANALLQIEGHEKQKSINDFQNSVLQTSYENKLNELNKLSAQKQEAKRISEMKDTGFFDAMGRKFSDVFLNQLPKDVYLNHMMQLPANYADAKKSSKWAPILNDINFDKPIDDIIKEYGEAKAPDVAQGFLWNAVQPLIGKGKIKSVPDRLREGIIYNALVETKKEMGDSNDPTLAKTTFAEKFTRATEKQKSKEWQSAQVQDEESGKYLEGIPQTWEDAKLAQNRFAYVGGAVGNAAGSSVVGVSVPASGVYAMEAGEAYDSYVKAKASNLTEKYGTTVTPDQVILAGEDKDAVDIAQNVGMINGALENVGMFFGAGKLAMNVLGKKITQTAVKKGLGKQLVQFGKSLGGAMISEGGTEMLQSMNTIIGKKVVDGMSVDEAIGSLNEKDVDDILESGRQGAIGGIAFGGGAAVSENINQRKANKSIESVQDMVDVAVREPKLNATIEKLAKSGDVKTNGESVEIVSAKGAEEIHDQILASDKEEKEAIKAAADKAEASDITIGDKILNSATNGTGLANDSVLRFNYMAKSILQNKVDSLVESGDIVKEGDTYRIQNGKTAKEVAKAVADYSKHLPEYHPARKASAKFLEENEAKVPVNKSDLKNVAVEGKGLDLKRVAEDGATPEVKRTAKSLLGVKKALAKIAPNTRVIFFKDDAAGVETLRSLGYEVEEGKQTNGFHDEKNSIIAINTSEAQSNTSFHEGIHPVINLLQKQSPKTFESFSKQAAGIAHPDGGTYGEVMGSEEEALVEVLADVADGKFDKKSTPVQAVVKFINNVLEKVGLPTIGVTPDITTLKNYASDLAIAIRDGRTINTGRTKKKVQKKSKVKNQERSQSVTLETVQNSETFTESEQGQKVNENALIDSTRAKDVLDKSPDSGIGDTEKEKNVKFQIPKTKPENFTDSELNEKRKIAESEYLSLSSNGASEVEVNKALKKLQDIVKDINIPVKDAFFNPEVERAGRGDGSYYSPSVEQELDVKLLHPSQPFVQKGSANFADPRFLPSVTLNKGIYSIDDGHNRIALAIAKGDKKVKVNVNFTSKKDYNKAIGKSWFSFQDRKISKTAKRVAKDAKTKFVHTQADILSNPDAYSYDVQSNANKRAELGQLSLADLAAIQTNEALRNAIGTNGNFSILAGIELFKRLNAAGREAEATEIFKAIRENGTSIAQLLQQMGELKTTPQGMQSLVEKNLESMGLFLTPDQKVELEKVTSAYVKASEARNEARRNYLDTPTSFGVKRLEKMNEEAGKAFQDLGLFVGRVTPMGIDRMLLTILQGNLLVPKSVVTNVVGNALNPTKYAEKAVGNLSVYLVNRISGKNPVSAIEMFWGNTLNSIGSFGKALWTGPKEAVTGQSPSHELLDSLEVRSNLAPLTAFRQLLPKAMKGSLKDTLPVDKDGNIPLWLQSSKAIEATLGINPNIMFKLLEVGDKPFRDSAKSASIYKVYAELGGAEKFGSLEQFQNSMTPEQGKRVEKMTNEVVFSDDGDLYKIVNKFGVPVIDKGIPALFSWVPGIGSTLEIATRVLSKTILPYVKIPSNLLQRSIEYTMPIIPMIRAARAYKAGDARTGGEMTARAILGILMWYALDAMYAAGVIVAGSSDDDKEVRALKYESTGLNMINTTAFMRMMNGTQDPNNPKQEGDEYIDFTRAGILGIIGAIRSEVNETLAKSPDAGLSALTSHPMNWLGAQFNGVIKGSLEISFLQQSMNMMEEFGKSGFTGIGTEMLGSASAILLPNNFMMFTKAKAPYQLRASDEDALTEFAEKVSIKMFPNQKDGMSSVYPIIGMFGTPVKPVPDGVNPYVYQFFDISKKKTLDDPFIVELLNLYSGGERLKPEQIPISTPTPDIELPVNDSGYSETDGSMKHFKLEEQDWVYSQMLAGRVKKFMVAMVKDDGTWSESNDSEKNKILKTINERANKAAKSYMLAKVMGGLQDGSIVVRDGRYHYVNKPAFDYNYYEANKELFESSDAEEDPE